MEDIKFGTDGWRAVIGDAFTFANVKRATQATCDVARKLGKSRLIVIGYDRRFFSDRFANTAADVAAANGFKVEISEEPITSPCLSFHVKQRKAALGIMITASHNPFYFNGFKLKGPHGGSVDESVTSAVENRLDVTVTPDDGGAIKRVRFAPDYLADLKKRVSPASFARLKAPIVFDAMHGPGGVFFQQLVGKRNGVVTIRTEADPLFGGVNPEPIEVNLDALKKAVLENKAAIGLAVDGDADRIGVIDDKGRYLPPHTVMPLILTHLVENRKLKGKVVQTVSMGYLTRRIAEKAGLPFEEVSVGFKYIAKRMGEEKVLFGGEESGGYGVGLWSPERDGLLCALLLLEFLAVAKRPLSEIVADLEKRYGVSHFKRVDFPVSDPVDKAAWTARVTDKVAKVIGGQNVKSINPLDGLKVTVDDDSWVLMRPSGTEPLFRTYAEGTSPKIVEELLVEAHRLATLPPPKPPAEPKKSKRRSSAASL